MAKVKDYFLHDLYEIDSTGAYFEDAMDEIYREQDSKLTNLETRIIKLETLIATISANRFDLSKINDALTQFFKEEGANGNC